MPRASVRLAQVGGRVDESGEGELLFWRPVPGFVPSAAAMAPAEAIAGLLSGALRDAVPAGRLRPEAADERALELLSVLHFGVLSQHLANAPGQDWDTGPFTRLHGEVVALFTARYAPAPEGRMPAGRG